MSNKIAIITGASRGIGKAIALDLAGQNYHVLLIARQQKALDAVAAEIEKKGGQASSYALDITDRDKIEKCISDIIEKFKRVDILVNNAGVLYLKTSETPYDEKKKMIELNLLAAMHLTSLIVPQMKKQKSGYIFNIASTSAKRAIQTAGSYAATKFGLLGYSEALFKELIPYNVKVTSICPGVTNTDMTSGMTHIISKDEMIPVEELTKTLKFLLSLGPTASVKEIVIDNPKWLLKEFCFEY